MSSIQRSESTVGASATTMVAKDSIDSQCTASFNGSSSVVVVQNCWKHIIKEMAIT